MLRAVATIAPETDAAAGRFCPGCGYDCRGLPAGGRCPECGLSISSAAAYQLLWERRAELGRVSTFVRTAWLTMAHPARLAAAAAGPVDVRSGRTFRRTVVAVLAAAFAGGWAAVVRAFGTTAFVDLTPTSPAVAGSVWPTGVVLFLWSAGATLWPVVPVAIGVTVALGFGTGHWFAVAGANETASRRGRLMAAGFYAAGSVLGFVVPVTILAAVLAAAGRRAGWPTRQLDPSPLGAMVGGGTLVVALLAIVLCHSRLVLHGTRNGWRTSAVAAGMVAQWAVAAGVGLVGVPIACGFVRVVVVVVSLW